MMWLLAIPPDLVIGAFSLACFICAGWLWWELRP
jgi:hypothetical protein